MFGKIIPHILACVSTRASSSLVHRQYLFLTVKHKISVCERVFLTWS